MLLPEETRNIKKSLEKLFEIVFYPITGIAGNPHEKITAIVPSINKSQLLGLASIIEEEQCEVKIEGSFPDIHISFSR